MGKTRKVATVAAVAVALLGGASAAFALPQSSPEAASRPETRSGVTVPPELTVPAGYKLVAELPVDHGSQIYTCANGAWTFLEPAAVLRSWHVQALHSKGPIWISPTDGSSVTAAVTASLSTQGTIPQLLLKSTANRGDGLFGNVSYIQRLNTSGGLAPTGSCSNGAIKAVEYRADYFMYVPQ